MDNFTGKSFNLYYFVGIGIYCPLKLREENRLGHYVAIQNIENFQS